MAAEEEHDSDAVRVMTSDGQEFALPRKVAEMSMLIKSIVDEDDSSREVVPLANVSSSVMVHVIRFCNMHVETPMPELEKPLRSSNLEEVMPKPYADLVNALEQNMMFELIMAANYLDIPPLLDLASAKVASLIKGKTPEEIRQTFNIRNDFTPEEECFIDEKHRWVEE